MHKNGMMSSQFNEKLSSQYSETLSGWHISTKVNSKGNIRIFLFEITKYKKKTKKKKKEEIVRGKG